MENGKISNRSFPAFLFMLLVLCVFPEPGFLFPNSKPVDGSSLKAWKACGGVEGMCQCKTAVADCSKSFGRLAFIPRLAGRIRTLRFADNNLTVPIRADFFQNVTSLMSLDLGYNSLDFASDGVTDNAFYLLTNLTTLHLSGNSFYRILLEKFQRLFAPLKSLKFLNIGQTAFRVVFPGMFTTLKSLTKLWLNNNMIPYVAGGAFSELKRLTVLRLDNNLISQVADGTFLGLGHLKTLRLDGNGIEDVTGELFSGLSALRVLRLDNNLVKSLAEKAFVDFGSLRTLRLDDNYLESIAKKHFAGLANLRSLRLDDNLLMDIHEDAFGDLKQLSSLRLDSNLLETIPDKLFSSQNNLLELRVDDNNLWEIPARIFTNCASLTSVRLDDNKILEIPQGVFDDLDLLTHLRLDDNLIETVSEETFSPRTRGQLTSLNLSHNPFECQCSLLWFRDWVESHPGLFDFQNADSSYECENIPDTDLAAFVMNKQHCLLSHDAYVFTVVCAGVLIFTLIVMTSFYHFRWHIRLRLYEAFRGNPHTRGQQRGDFQYDMFVSYDSEDFNWVVNHLLPVLEQDMGLRLCVHQRDFIPGKNIVENILESLEVSRRVLAVFSPNFAESQWCHFELEMCLSHVIDNNDVMLIVILQHVPSRDMSGAMLALMNTTTYIEWADDPDATASFWRRMTLTLNEMMSVV